MTEIALRARGLTARFDHHTVLHDVDLDLRAGEIAGLRGANGAGKTTLLKLLCGLRRPSAGRVTIAPSSAGSDSGGPRGARRRALFGYLGHETGLYGSLSARENLLFVGRLHGSGGVAARVDALLSEWGLAEIAGRRVSSFSRGLRQRVALARTFLHRPRILLLDEPWNALDVAASAMLSTQLRAFRAGGGTALISGHDTTHSADLAARQWRVAEGRVTAMGPTP